jgi:diguanylate cyclase (GGDEF)-like protein
LTKNKKIVLFFLVLQYFDEVPIMARKKTRTKEQELEIENRWLKRQHRRSAQEIVRYKEIAYYDTLTAEARVLTKFGFLEQLKSRLSEVEARTLRGDVRQNALLYIDMDDFKVINDTYGHSAGDIVLKAVSKAIQDGLRDSDVLGRLHGDEFAILARVRGEEGLARLQWRIKNTITLLRVQCKGEEVTVRASIGGSTLRTVWSSTRLHA